MTTEPIAARARVVPTAERAADDGFRAFYEDHYSRLVRYCYRLTGDEQAAFDLAQESFTRLLTRWVGIREPDAYLFHVATNLARRTYARAQREAAALAESRPVPRDAERDAQLRVAVDGLRRRYREIVLLHYFADLPVAAVAAAVRRPRGTVLRQLAEARALLAADLEDQSDV